MKSSSQYGRKANQKLAFAEAILALPQEHFQEFVGEALLEAVYLELEQAICLHVAEELSRFGHSEAFMSGDSIDRAWLRQRLQSSTSATALAEIRQLLGDTSSWLSHILDACDRARSIPAGEKTLKSPLFSDEIPEARPEGLIKAVTPEDLEGKLDRTAASWALKALREDIARHRGNDEEY